MIFMLLKQLPPEIVPEVERITIQPVAVMVGCIWGGCPSNLAINNIQNRSNSE